MTIVEERFGLACQRIQEISVLPETHEKFRPFFTEVAGYLAVMAEEYDWVAQGKHRAAELMELERHNEICFIDLAGKNYDTNYANPVWAVEKLGQEYGRLLCALSAELHSLPAYVYEQDLEAVTIRMELFLEIYSAFFCAWQEEKGIPPYGQLKDIYYWFASDYMEPILEQSVSQGVDWEQDFAVRILEESDLADLRYLFYYGEYIADDQWRTAEHLNSLPEEKIQKIADTIAEGFCRGFALAGKPLDKKKSVGIRYPLGFERVVRALIDRFRGMGLEPVISRAPASFLAGRRVYKNGFFGASVNRQFEYDHENDQALYLDRKFMHHKLECCKKAWEACREKASVYAGPAVIECFGEMPFAPKHTEQRLTLSDKQRALSVEYQSRAGVLATEYMDPEERSFTIIAFPVPGIGEAYPEIFDEILKINTMDQKAYGVIQQRLIDALDKAAWVRVRGMGENATDLKIMLRRLEDPERETNFENCLADVNIPVGEVFTSPQLAGTQGLLHVSRVYLNGMEYRDLKITFRDGMVTDYTCANFASSQESRELLREQVMFRHETLPLGEFAIGTNTLAYVTAEKYGIQDKMPILIAEKTGPHFALGDTCYSHEEDRMTYNPDGKAIVARNNEVSARRKEDPAGAYFNCHTDITIPYDELGELTAVAGDETECVIIKDGRFVLEGTEELNAAFYRG